MNPASTRVTPESQTFTKVKPPAGRELDLDIARSLRMYRKTAIWVGLIVFLFLLLFGLSRRPYYETQALIYIQPMKTHGVTDVGGGFDEQRYESFLQQQLQTITRTDILQNALERPEARAWRGHGVPMQVMTTILQHSLKVDRVEQSYEVSISLAGSSPQAIADMVNAVSTAYIQGERADELAQTDQQLQILETDRQHIEDQMAADRKEQVQLSVSLGVADTTGDSGNPYDTQLTELRSELAKATAAHDAAVAEQSAIRGGEPNATVSLSAAAEAIVATDPGLASYKQTTAARMSLLSSQMSGLTAQNPIYQQDQKEMDRLSDDLTQLEQAVRARVIKHIEQERAVDVRRTQELQSRLQQQLSSMTSVATGATPHLQRAAELAEDIKRLEVRYSDVDNAISSIELEKDTTGLVHVILPATPPLAPKTSIKRLILLLSLPFGIFMGVLAAVVKRKSNPRIFVARDISSTFGFYPMATLPDPDDVGKDVNDEAMLRLLAGIDQIHRTEKCQTFTFTSVSARSSVNGLAESLARKMRRLGYSVATMKAEDLIDETRIGSSGTVPSMAMDEYSGNPVSPTHENFAVAKLDAYRESADFVFLEAAPILTSSVAEFTARLSDVIVLIADSGRTTRGQMRNAIDLIERLRLPGLTTVLCGLRLLNADDGFITAVESTRRRQENIETVEATVGDEGPVLPLQDGHRERRQQKD